VEHGTDRKSVRLSQTYRTELLSGCNGEPIRAVVGIRETDGEPRDVAVIKGYEPTRLLGVRPTRVFEHRVGDLRRHADTLDAEADVRIVKVL